MLRIVVRVRDAGVHGGMIGGNQPGPALDAGGNIEQGEAVVLGFGETRIG